MNRERFTQSGMSSVDVGKEQLTWLIYLRNEEKEKRGLAEQILICVWTEASECARRCAKLSQRGSCPRSHLSAKRRGGQFRLARCGTCLHPPQHPGARHFPFSLPSFLSLSPYTINSGLYHNTFSHKKCHRRASLMAPEKMDCFTRSLFKMRPLFLRVARVFLFTGDVCGIDVRGGFRLGLTLCFDGCLDVLCVF